MPKITIEDLITAVRLVKTDTCQNFATTDAIARMLAVRKMDVLLFLEQNPKLVHTEEKFRPKTVSVTAYGHGVLAGKKWRTKEVVNGASLGLCVTDAYATPEDNPWNGEWLEAAKARYAKTLWLSKADNYGEIVGHYFAEDRKPSNLSHDQVYADNRRNEWLWRNTHEKLEAAKSIGGCFDTSFVFGGFGDACERKFSYGVSGDSLDVLKKGGWTVIGT